ncbi:MAG: hypothetical protein QOF11_1728 [Chloroflexota bacterium]|nr:hypothetical protein [Chloroflexota bacterium]
MTSASPSEGPDLRIARNRARFDELVGRAEDELARGRLEAAAVCAQVAAALAWHSPTGLFASPRLESALRAIARESMTPLEPATRGTEIRTVLHVLTTAQRVGGHTRLAWRWIERDEGRVHSVAVTRQAHGPLPEAMLEAVRARGGRIHRIDRAASGIIARAAALQTVAAQADLVVLHVHPFDVVPSIALAGLDRSGARPPAILLNHADHLFWIGLSSSDLVLHLRASGARLSATRRGLSPDRSGILPVPLSPAPPPAQREAARRLLGYSNGEVLAVSIASGYKFGPADGDGLLPLLEQALERSQDLRVLAIGPGHRADWRAAAKRTAGRIASLGNKDDLTAISAAADIYLDSYPFSSLTSMLEAGQLGLPLLAYGVTGPETGVLGFDDPATEGLAVRARTPAEYLVALEALVDDPAARRERGQQIRRAIAADHEGQGWRDHLERAYSQAAAVHASPRDEPHLDADPAPGAIGELDRRLVGLLDAQQADAPAGVRGHLRLAPFGLRLEEWRRSRGTAQPLSILVLLPERAIMLARRAGMLAHSARRALRRSVRSRARPDHGGDAA